MWLYWNWIYLGPAPTTHLNTSPSIPRYLIGRDNQQPKTDFNTIVPVQPHMFPHSVTSLCRVRECNHTASREATSDHLKRKSIQQDMCNYYKHPRIVTINLIWNCSEPRSHLSWQLYNKNIIKHTARAIVSGPIQKMANALYFQIYILKSG